MALSPLGSGWEPLVRRVADALAPGAPFQAAASIARLLDLVGEWNARVDLTAARSPEELVDLYVADALVIARHAAIGEQAPAHWVDVGSGAGAPGIPLALLAPEIRVTLVEPRAKRVAFLRTALGVLGRADVAVQRARSEQLAAGGFDVATSRATLAPDAWLAEGARLARGTVWVLLARGAEPALAGWRLDLDLPYRWPLAGAERRALRFVPERDA
jgi:16S rRNA (guanine527-N7)-methyltransferase